MLGQGSILTAKERESGCAAREILQSSLPSSHTLMTERNGWLNLFFTTRSLRLLEAGRTGGFGWILDAGCLAPEFFAASRATTPGTGKRLFCIAAIVAALSARSDSLVRVQ
jgi:hypothetical protein